MNRTCNVIIDPIFVWHFYDFLNVSKWENITFYTILNVSQRIVIIISIFLYIYLRNTGIKYIIPVSFSLSWFTDTSYIMI